MSTSQREQNPDVNSYNPDVGPGEDPGATSDGETSNDIERNQNESPTRVPPDTTPAAPVEEPPDTHGAPVGDVDDSPRRIA
jgi:hypothetical protein